MSGLDEKDTIENVKDEQVVFKNDDNKLQEDRIVGLLFVWGVIFAMTLGFMLSGSE